VSDEPRNPSLVDILLKQRRSMIGGMQITLPAVVTRYDATRQCVDAQPTTTQERASEDGITIEEWLPPVLSVPVMFYGGSGVWADTIPIAVGQVVVLHFSSVALDRWLTIGGTGVNPQSPSRHATDAGAFAYPGGHSFAGSTAPKTTAPTTARVFHGPGDFRFGSPSSSKVPSTLTDLQALKAAIAAATVPPGDLGAAALAAIKAAVAGWNPTGSPRIKVP
jgi:hypothetical protein